MYAIDILRDEACEPAGIVYLLDSDWIQLKKRSGFFRKADRDATSNGSSLFHKPVSGERKSGMPEGVETPAPVKATAWFECASNSAAFLIPAFKSRVFII